MKEEMSSTGATGWWKRAGGGESAHRSSPAALRPPLRPVVASVVVSRTATPSAALHSEPHSEPRRVTHVSCVVVVVVVTNATGS